MYLSTFGKKSRTSSFKLHFLFSSDLSIPFSRWDRERIVAWLNEIGLNMYLSECRRWVKNGEQLLKASGHEIEKVALLYPPQNEVLGGYTVFSLSVIPSFRHSVIPSFRHSVIPSTFGHLC